MSIALWLHLLGVVVWVGGMFFAHMALRPAAQALAPPQRLPLLAQTLRRFFGWVALSVVTILATGAWMIGLLGGSSRLPASVHAMTGIGVLMALVFAWIVARPFRVVLAAVGEGNWPRAGEAMVAIRRLVGFNLVLGLVALTVAILGRGT